MKKTVTIFLVLLTANHALAQPTTSRSNIFPIEQIVSSYSERYEEQVLVDPRVKGKANIYGQALSDISYENLTTILHVHSFGTYRSGGYLVVVPLNVIKQHPLELVQANKQYASNK